MIADDYRTIREAAERLREKPQPPADEPATFREATIAAVRRWYLRRAREQSERMMRR